MLLARIFLLHSLSADPLTEFGLIGCFIIKGGRGGGERGSKGKMKRKRENERKKRVEYRIAMVFDLPPTSRPGGDYRVDSSSNRAPFGGAYSFERGTWVIREFRFRCPESMFPWLDETASARSESFSKATLSTPPDEMDFIVPNYTRYGN